ncbi:MAG: hypothetical protein V3V01_19390 [Acidimicrobiales bacterium]
MDATDSAVVFGDVVGAADPDGRLDGFLEWPYETFEQFLLDVDDVFVGEVTGITTGRDAPPDAVKRALIISVEESFKGDPVGEVVLEDGGEWLTETGRAIQGSHTPWLKVGQRAFFFSTQAAGANQAWSPWGIIPVADNAVVLKRVPGGALEEFVAVETPVELFLTRLSQALRKVEAGAVDPVPDLEAVANELEDITGEVTSLGSLRASDGIAWELVGAESNGGVCWAVVPAATVSSARPNLCFSLDDLRAITAEGAVAMTKAGPDFQFVVAVSRQGTDISTIAELASAAPIDLDIAQLAEFKIYFVPETTKLDEPKDTTNDDE